MQIPVKVKATGEIVDVTISVATAGNPLYTTSGGVTYLGDDIEPAELDWQQVRIQAAIAAMQGLVSNEIHLNHADKVAEEKGINTSTFLAKCAIDIADALVAELKHSDDVYAECRKMRPSRPPQNSQRKWKGD